MHNISSYFAGTELATFKASLGVLPSFQERMDALQRERLRARNENPNRFNIYITGAGPAGLSRAISALIQGQDPLVIEKKGEGDNERENTVALETEAIDRLCYFGVYQYLIENRLVVPSSSRINVRLKDLETGMKAVIAQLSSRPVIQYNAQIASITSNPFMKAQLNIRCGGASITIPDIDLLVVAEGAHSATSENLLTNRRIDVLPKLPVVAAIFQDDRPAISGVKTFFEYAGKTMAHTATSIYYYAICLFRMVIYRQHIFNPQRDIAGSLILTTPNQNYLGAAFSKEETAKLSLLREKVKSTRIALGCAEVEGVPEPDLAVLRARVEVAKQEQDAYLRYWSSLGFCFANLIALFTRFVQGNSKLQNAFFLPYSHAHVAEIGADRSAFCSGTLGTSACLVSGDSLVTVDPVTGLGCNAAISTTQFFDGVLMGMKDGHSVDALLGQYDIESERVIDNLHHMSKIMRQAYRPDLPVFV